MRAFRLLASGFSLLTSGSWLLTPVYAQSPDVAGRMVNAVHIEIEDRREAAADLRVLIETRVGQPLDLREARESVAQLYAAGRFDDVRVEARSEGDGVVLVYRLEPRHPVTKIDVRGETGMARRALQDALETRFEGLSSAPPDDDAAAVARTLLADEGYRFASVSVHAEVSHSPHRTTLVFDVRAGEPAPIGEVIVEGSWPGTRENLLAALDAAPGRPYRRSRLIQAIEETVARMRRARRYTADISHTARPSADGRRVDLVIQADAGPVVDVRFAGDPMSRDRLDALVPIERERAVDLDLLEDSTLRIAADLRREGYWRANVSYRTAEQDDRLDVVFTISRGPRYRLGSLAVDGNAAVSDAALLGFVNANEGDIFVEAPLQTGARRIQDYYRRAGFAAAEVTLDVSELPEVADAEPRVAARFVVNEGEQSFIESVQFSGVTAIAEDDLRQRMVSRAGDPYYLPHLMADREAILRAYLDRGYQQAAVGLEPSPRATGPGLDITVTVLEGPQTIVDRVIVVGNSRTDTQTILDEVTLRQGSPLGLTDIVESQRRLSALGLFRVVRLTEGPRRPGTSTVDLIVTLEEAPATTIGYGGGFELVERLRTRPTGAEDVLEFSPRGFFEITRRNIAGGNRSLSLFTRLSFAPDDVPHDPERDGRGFGISEYRVVSTYREPRAFAFDADLLVSAGLERAIRTSFSFNRRLASTELLKRLTPTVRVSGRYSLEYTTLVDQGIREDERLLIDRLFPQFRLSIFSTSLTRDTRDDPVDPGRGSLAVVDLDVAPRALGSEVGFVRSFGQVFRYARLPFAPRVVLAAGARIGLARGFSRIVESPQPVTEAGVEVREVPASQRFFAGGGTTVRGFQLDRLGVPEILNTDGLSNGGNAMLVLNGEVRIPVWKALGAVAFVDAGNVFARVGDFDLSRLRPTAGVGLRYRSPIGPVRVDLGFKLNRETFPNRRESDSQWHFSFGHAF